MAKYGLPYMGSKSAVADKIIAVLPAGDRFIDLFGGGGAMTHAAALSGKYGEVIYSDADPLACEYITRAIRGDYSPERLLRAGFPVRNFSRKRTPIRISATAGALATTAIRTYMAATSRA